MFLNVSLLILAISAVSFVGLAHTQALTPEGSSSDVTPSSSAPGSQTNAEETISPEEVAFNRRSAALGQRVLEVDAQMKAAARLAALNPDDAKMQLNEIEANFQAEIDAFIQDFISFAAQKEVSLSEEERLSQRRGVENMAAQLVTIPESMRWSAEVAAALPETSAAD